MCNSCQICKNSSLFFLLTKKVLHCSRSVSLLLTITELLTVVGPSVPSCTPSLFIPVLCSTVPPLNQCVCFHWESCNIEALCLYAQWAQICAMQNCLCMYNKAGCSTVAASCYFQPGHLVLKNPIIFSGFRSVISQSLIIYGHPL